MHHSHSARSTIEGGEGCVATRLAFSTRSFEASLLCSANVVTQHGGNYFLFSFSTRFLFQREWNLSFFFTRFVFSRTKFHTTNPIPKMFIVRYRRGGDGDGFGILRPLIVEPFQDGFVL